MVAITRLKFVLCLTSVFPLIGQTSGRIQLERIAQGVPQCTDIQSPRDGSGRLFLVQQNGVVRIWRNGSLEAGNFLDLRGRISTGGERGLLGLAFPPGFAAKRYFYVNYTNPSGTTVVSRIRLSSDSQANLASEQILLSVAQPFSNHNGGQLQFGPDGMLYIGLGDGGSANDPRNNGQNPLALLGKMLRIDVESDPARYLVPPDNPFVNNPAYAPEIWALGLRNPWRYAFDRETGGLFIADVGQNAWEEISYQPPSSRGGENYGWVTMEGNVCVRSGCNTTGLTLPVHVYPRSEGLSITGGYVYRGQRYPSLRGVYLYGDYVTGRLWGLRQQGGGWVNELLIDLGRSFSIATFGEDEDGELFVANHSEAEIFRIRGQEQVQPQLSAAGLVNAASFTAGLVPGSLATAFTSGLLSANQTLAAAAVPLPTALGGIRLRINGEAVPLLAIVRNAQGEQVNFQVPWQIPAGSTARLDLEAAGQTSAVVESVIARLAPGVFSQDGNTALLIQNSSFALASSLNRTDIYVAYATGLGPLESPLASGAASAIPIRLASSAALTIGGVPAQISYAGAAPGFPGVYQINFRAGAGTPAGNQDLVLTIDSVASPARRVNVLP